MQRRFGLRKRHCITQPITSGQSPASHERSTTISMTRNQRSARTTGWALGLFATLCFSVAPPVASAAIGDGLHPTAILVVRMALTAALLVITIAVMDMRLLRTDRRGLQVTLIAGLVNSVGMVAYFWALTRLSTSVSAMLFSVSPLMVLSLLALRGEPVTRRHGVRLALALGGIYLLIGPSGGVDLMGLLYIFIALVAFSLQVVIIQWYLAGYDARTGTLYMTIGMWLGVTICWLFQGAPWSAPTMGGWISILALAVVSTYLARLACFGAIGRIGGAQQAMLTPLEILLTILWSVLFLGERLTLAQWLGGLLILGSALLAIERLGSVRRPIRWRFWARA